MEILIIIEGHFRYVRLWLLEQNDEILFCRCCLHPRRSAVCLCAFASRFSRVRVIVIDNDGNDCTVARQQKTHEDRKTHE